MMVQTMYNPQLLRFPFTTGPPVDLVGGDGVMTFSYYNEKYF